MYKGEQLTIGYQQATPVLREVSFELKGNSVTAIIGPNGSGKTSLLRVLSRLLKPIQGQVWFSGKRLPDLATKQFAKEVALLPQSPGVPDDFSVYDLVSLGRFPYQNWLGQLSKEDHRIVLRAMDLAKVTGLMHRKVSSLSGGERQRAYIAMALAQQPRVFLLDEPITFLDVNHQIEVMELLTHLQLKLEIMVVMVLHNLDFALRYADEVLVLHENTLVAQGKPANVINPSLCAEVFNIDARFFHADELAHKVFVPMRKQRDYKIHIPKKLRNSSDG